ncbi:UNVERIFIED_CONTAM: hypothetical protein FKN15_074577 [Acipenser sinensis]
MNTRCPLKRVLSATCFFTLCRLIVEPPQSYSVRGQRSSGHLTGKPAGARPDYRGPWELPSTVGCGIAWTRTCDVQAIESILHSSECFYWMSHSGAPYLGCFC